METYIHINNGGVTLGVEDSEFGPTLTMKATHFGHTTNGLNVHVTHAVLSELAKMFALAAAKQNYQKTPEHYPVAGVPHYKEDGSWDSSYKKEN